MTVEKVDLTAIGLFSLVGLPYSLKFLWSPLLDWFTLPFLGGRRGWLIITPNWVTNSDRLPGIQQPKQALQLLAINAVAITFLSATQDIAADAYRTDVLEPLEMGAGAAVFVLGYRIALLLTRLISPQSSPIELPGHPYIYHGSRHGIGIICHPICTRTQRRSIPQHP